MKLPTISLQRSLKGLPLHRQIYEALRDLILSGELPADIRLPSTRALAKTLGISRNTVLSAYEELYARSYLQAKTGSGSWVCSGIRRKELQRRLIPARAFVSPSRTRPGLNLQTILQQARFPVQRLNSQDVDGTNLYLYSSNILSWS
ncbi:MAG TPA: winged helix-turn-helix domain-containing protein [Candidatus Acidoferrum sp.]|nr:winged helix-turn-helix domain-containing protein [Candidatus Acidoferrum sp.]